MINIREYKEGDEEGIVSLFNDVFEKNRDLDYWNWQFVKNPAKKPIIVLGEKDGVIVGQCTILPTKIIVENNEIYIGQSIDTMIHKEYRGQGLHKVLAEKTYEIAKKEDIKIRIGFPSQDALRGLLGGIGGSLITSIPLYMKVYKLDSFFKPIVKIDFLAKALSILGMPLVKLIYREKKVEIKKDYEIKEIKEFNNDFDLFWNRIKDENPMMSIRDSKFLNWRIKEHPKNQYTSLAAYLDGEIKGYIIFKTENKLVRRKIKLKLGSIVDILVDDSEVIAYLYYEAKKYFKKENVDFVTSWVTDSMKYKDLLIELGFKESKSKIPFVVKSLDQDKELEKFKDKEENWYLMPIESDFY